MFCIFLVFGMTKNNSQIKSIFGLTKKATLFFVKLFPSFKTVNHFLSLSIAHFSFELNAKKYFQENHFFVLKNDLVENISN
jgi:hypothetical protein